LGFQVIEAAKAAKHGGSLNSILGIVKNIKQKARVFAMLDTLEYIRRSGRVSWARAKIGDLLRYKQFVEVKDGDVFSLSKVRTRKKGIQHLLSLIQQQNELTYLAILHTNAEKDAREILTQVKNRIDHQPYIINVTTAIGTHVGPNGLGFAAVLK
jgi:DegV family protein with EDD domain